jgi:signal transduction histidine kinase
MTESATTSPMRGRFDRRFAGGVPWDPPPGPGAFAGSAPIVLPDRNKPKPSPSPAELEELGRKTATVAHDFNNLLSVIMVCAGEIADETDGVHRERAEEIREAALRGAGLCRSLLTEERAASGGAPAPQAQSLAADEAILGSRKLIERALGPRIRLDLTSDGTLPQIALAGADLERVLLNLAANSRDAMPRGGAVAVRTETVAVPPGDPRLGTGLHARITFADDGMGMSPDVAGKALEPYFSTKGEEAGSGLGLAGAVAMTRAAGGDLRINSQPGIGTTISIYLPALDASGRPLALPPRC